MASESNYSRFAAILSEFAKILLTLAPNENILMVIRRHWFALFRHMTTLIIFSLLPFLFFAVTNAVSIPALAPQMRGIINFSFSLYGMGLLLYALIIWVDYYLDVWIITDRRLIDIEQQGLFSRTISEIPIQKIQNVTVEIPGFMATVLRFGNVKVETASQSAFIIRDVPRAYEAKDVILKYAHQQSTNYQQPTNN